MTTDTNITSAVVTWIDPRNGETGRYSTQLAGVPHWQAYDYYMAGINAKQLNIGHGAQDRMVRIARIDFHPAPEKLPSCITVHARKWRDSHGNTYHSVVCFNVDTRAYLVVKNEYGSGDHWQQTAAEAIERQGWLPMRDHYANGGAESLHHWLESHGVALVANGTDVPRKRDMMAVDEHCMG